MIADVYTGKIHPRIAAGLAPLMNLQLHAIKTADFEQRLVKLAQQLKQRDGTWMNLRRRTIETAGADLRHRLVKLQQFD